MSMNTPDEVPSDRAAAAGPNEGSIRAGKAGVLEVQALGGSLSAEAGRYSISLSGGLDGLR